jgi:hypothetical protein
VDCKEFGTLADDYVFDLLDSCVEQSVEAHLGSCDSCRKLAEDARMRRNLFLAWKPDESLEGAGRRLMARLEAGNYRRQSARSSLLVRMMAAAAVILAAVVLPRLFLFESPAVMSWESQTTVVQGEFHRLLRQELNIPKGVIPNAYVAVHLKSIDGKSAVSAAISLNGDDGSPVLSSGGASEEIFLLGTRKGLRQGVNFLVVENHGQVPLQFDVTLVTGGAK